MCMRLGVCERSVCVIQAMSNMGHWFADMLYKAGILAQTKICDAQIPGAACVHVCAYELTRQAHTYSSA